MKLVKRVCIATALLIGLFAAAQQPPASASGGKEGEGPEATACSWGYVECPSDGLPYEYTTRQCYPQCLQAVYPSLSAALTGCDNNCDVACVNHGFVGTCQ